VAEIKVKCPRCGAEMNHHADKLLALESEISANGAIRSTVMELHSCPACGSSASRCVPAYEKSNGGDFIGSGEVRSTTPE
jgi:ribosomal protein S27AE